MASGKSLGTLTLDLVARTGGFEQGLDKAERASQKQAAAAEKAAKASAKAVNSVLSSLEKQVSVLGMSADQQKLYELSLKGATEEQIKQAQSALDSIGAFESQTAAAKALADEQEALKSSAEALRKSIDDDVKSLQDEAAVLGKSAKEQKLYELQTKGATEAQLKQARAALTSIENHEQLKKTFDALKVGAAVLAGGISYLVKTTVDGANEISKLAQISGASAEEFQRYAAGAKAVGIEQEKLGDIFKDVQDKVGDFLNTGGGALADFFENIAPQVGVTADEFRKLSGPQALGLYVDSLEKAGASQQDMTFYLEAIASDATALLPLLKNNAEGFKALGEQAAQAGAILDDQTIRSAQELQAVALLTSQTLDGLKNQLVAGLLPTLSDLSGALFQVSTDTEIARDTGEGFGSILKGMAATAYGAYSAVQLLGKSIGALGAAFSAAGVEGDDLLLGPLAPLVVSGKIGKNIDAFRNALNVGFSDISADVEKYAETLDSIWKAGAGGGAETDYAKRIKLIADLLEEARKSAGSSGAVFKKNADEMKAAEAAAKKLADEVEALARATKVYELVKSGLTPDEARYRVELEYASELTRETLELTRATELLGKQQEAAAESAKSALDEIARASEASAEQMRRAYERSAEAIEGVFRDLYRSAFDGFEGFEESLKSSFENLLVEMALIATRNAIIIPVVTSAGGALGLPQQAIGGITDALGLGDSGIGGIFGAGGGVAFGQTAATAILNSAYDFADITGAEWAYSLADTLGDPNTFAGLTTVLNNIPGLLAAGTALFSAGSSLAVPNSRVSPAMQGLGAVLAPAFSLPATILDNLTGGGLFGTSWQTVGQELAISIQDQIADATLVTLRERERSLWRGTSRSREEDPARDLDRQLSESFGLIYDSITSGAERIGFAAGRFSFTFDESIAGLTQEQVSEVINGALTDATEALIRDTIPGIDRLRLAGEQLTQTFQRVVGGVNVLQDAIDLFDLTDSQTVITGYAIEFQRVGEGIIAVVRTITQEVDRSSREFLEASDALTRLAGSAEQLQANINNFWDDFASDQQKVERTAELTNRLFDSLGLTLPQTREEVFALVQGLDIFSEAGREAFNAITASSDLIDGYFDNLERATTEALGPSSEQIADFTLALQQQIGALQASDAEMHALGLRFEDLRAQALGLGGGPLLELVDQLYALEAGAISAARAAAEAARTMDLQIRLLTAQGDDAGALALTRQRELEQAATDTERALLQQIFTAEDQAAAAQAAAAAAAIAARATNDLSSSIRDVGNAAAEERERLITELLQTVSAENELRRREREELSAGNRALYDQINALRDQREAVDEAVRAYTQLADQIGSFGNSINLAANDAFGISLSAARAQFADVSRRARLGDLDALQSFTAVGEQLLRASEAQASSPVELARDLARLREEAGLAEETARRQANLQEASFDELARQTLLLAGILDELHVLRGAPAPQISTALLSSGPLAPPTAISAPISAISVRASTDIDPETKRMFTDIRRLLQRVTDNSDAGIRDGVAVRAFEVEGLLTRTAA